MYVIEGVVVTVVLSSVQSALEFLAKENWDPKSEPLQFEGELAHLRVAIEGQGFDGEITGEIARALAVYQDAVYTFAKVVIHGDANIPYTRLSIEDRRLFELTISVEKGCTLLGIDFKKVMTATASKVREMDNETFKQLMIALALIGAGGFCIFHLGSKALDNTNQASQRDHVEEVLKNSVDGQNRQLEMLLDRFEALERASGGYSKAVASSLATAQSVGMTEFAKAAPQAESIKFGEAKLSRDDISTINSRAPRTVSEPLDVTDRFRVKAETTEGPVTKVTFFGEALPAELTADFIESEFSVEQANAMWAAIRERTPIVVQLRGSFLRGMIKGGVLVDIFDEVVSAAIVPVS